MEQDQEILQEDPLISDKDSAPVSTIEKKPTWLRRSLGRFRRYWVLGPVEIAAIIDYTDQAQKGIQYNETTSQSLNKKKSQADFKIDFLKCIRVDYPEIKDLSWDELVSMIAQWKVEAKAQGGYVKTGRFYVGSILAAVIPTAAGYVVGNGIASAIYSWAFVGIAATSIIAPIWVGVIGGIILMTLLGIGVYQYYKSVNEMEIRYNIATRNNLEKMDVTLNELKKKFLIEEDEKVEKKVVPEPTKELITAQEHSDSETDKPGDTHQFLMKSIVLDESQEGTSTDYLTPNTKRAFSNYKFEEQLLKQNQDLIKQNQAILQEVKALREKKKEQNPYGSIFSTKRCIKKPKLNLKYNKRGVYKN